MATLEAKLTANIKSLERALDKAKQEFKEYEESAERANNEAGKGSERAGRRLEGSNKRVSKSTRNASASAVEFGRILGDLPFGIQGVANNIQQLAFTLGAGAAFQIGIAAVTSLMLVFQRQNLTLKESLDFLSGGLSQAEIAQRKLTESFLEGVGAARSQNNTLGALLGVARDLTQDSQTRQRAIAKINEEYGKYLPNLTAENVNTEKVTKAVDKYNESLIRQAKIRGAQDLISKEFSKILELESKNVLDSVGALDLLTASFLSLGNTSGFVGNLTAQGIKSANKEISETQQRINSLRKTLQALLTEDLQVGGIETGTDGAIGRSVSEKVNNVLGEGFGDIVNVVPSVVAQIGASFDNLPNRIAPALTASEARLIEFKDRLANTFVDISGSISQGFSSLGAALAQGEGLFGAVGAAILSTLGAIVTQIGQASIAAGVAALSLKSLFANPVAAIAAGGLLVAIGSALGSATSAVGNIGTPSAGSGSSSGFSGPRSQSFSSGGFGDGTVVFEIEGQKLVGVLQRTLGRNQRLGGNVSLG